MGVRGSETVTLDLDEDKTLLRNPLDRYLGGTDSELADALLDESRAEVVIRIDPDRLYAWDFSDRMPNAREMSATKKAEPESPRY